MAILHSLITLHGLFNVKNEATRPNFFRVTLHFKDKDGSVTTVKAPVGMSILQVAHQNDVNLEGRSSRSSKRFFIYR